MAGADYDAAVRMLDWPLREILLAAEAKTIEVAERNYHHEVAVWATLAPYAKSKLPPPSLPAIIRKIEHATG